MSLKYEAMLAVQSIRPIRGRMPTKNTRDDYFRHIRAYLVWCKAEYGCRNIREAKPHLQDYADYLVASDYTPATIHTYLNACCRGCGVPLGSIRHPTRHAADFMRGREIDLKKLKKMQQKSPRAVCLAFAVGIRRDEYLALRVEDLVVDENDYPCVQVRKGKGGKYQLQRIDPGQFDRVDKIFQSPALPDGRILRKAELRHLNLHAIRAIVAWAYYRHTCSRLETEPQYRSQLEQEIRDRWDIYCRHKWDESQVRGTYWIRGRNRAYAVEHDLPIGFDRLAVKATSVFVLSHWRNDVTVDNYLLPGARMVKDIGWEPLLRFWEDLG